MMKITKEQENLPFSRALHFALHFSMDTIHGGSEEAVRAAEQELLLFQSEWALASQCGPGAQPCPSNSQPEPLLSPPCPESRKKKQPLQVHRPNPGAIFEIKRVTSTELHFQSAC